MTLSDHTDHVATMAPPRCPRPRCRDAAPWVARGGCRSGLSIWALAREGKGGGRIEQVSDRFSGIDELLELGEAPGDVVEAVASFPLR